jgi:aryl-alcohol dehydrogenase-like predicted oxidoreductase
LKTNNPSDRIDRRRFLQLTAAAVGAPAIWASGSEQAGLAAQGETEVRNHRETMTYRKLGRTDMVASRLVFGCGAALAGGKAVRLLDRAFEAGINFYDVGSDIYYKGSEQSLAPFMKAHRDQIWVVSKAPVPARVKPGEEISVQQAETAALQWTRLLERSLSDLDTDYVDAYYLMGVDNPSVVRSEELYGAFEKAREAGKVGFFGVAAHHNTQAVVEAAAETGWYDLAQIGITPGGWYDWNTKALEEGTPTLLQLQPVLQRLRDSGMGLVAMKAARHLAPRLTAGGSSDPTAFDGYYDDEAKAWPFNPFQRSYAYVLKHGLDVVNSDMQNFTHLEENLAAVKPGAVG